jgi:hypothetical protein
MRHIAPVVRVQWTLTGVEDEVVDARAIDGGREAVDLRLCWSVPYKIHGTVTDTGTTAISRIGLRRDGIEG